MVHSAPKISISAIENDIVVRFTELGNAFSVLFVHVMLEFDVTDVLEML